MQKLADIVQLATLLWPSSTFIHLAFQVWTCAVRSFLDCNSHEDL